ncbi:MAG: insulinase family protein [Oscillospiraceae bacterium]|nr:insulinase family protein [Oscillospiraceae bacterium]
MADQMIGNGIRYTEIIDPKFRSCLLMMQFYTARSAETAPALALLTDLLTASSAEYPGISALSLRLDSLYAADFSAKLSLCGDAVSLSFTASWLDDRFALEGENITGEMLKLVTGCLMRPHAENGVFCEPEFRICRQNLLDDIDCERNDKRTYALQRAASLCFQGEPAALPPYGSRKNAEAVTPALAYRIWKQLLTAAPIDVICILPEPKPVRSILTGAFAGLHRCPEAAPLFAPSPPKVKLLRETEHMAVNQSKLVMIYKYSDVPRDVMYLLNSVLGGINQSLLFMNVREKQSLCYYCQSHTSVLKGTLTVDCGVQNEDLEAAEHAIRMQIELLRKGEYPRSMLNEAVLDYRRRAAIIENSNADTAARIADNHLFDDSRTPEEIAAALERITPEQLSAAANQLIPDTVYTLYAEEAMRS